MAAVRPGPFDPTFESLRTFECPPWFRDAKFGIWSHWGPQAVPMYGDWYARNMYCEGSDQYRYHLRRYGHPSVVGYRSIVEGWRAENFDPEELMQLFVAAGARYFVGQAMHHDNFFNYASAIHPWNSVKVGPQKDITRLWQDAAKQQGLPFGLSEHLGATFTWWKVNKGRDRSGPFAGIPYDGADPAQASLYLNNHQHYDPEASTAIDVREWYTPDRAWHEHWLDVMVEIIDQYKPDLLYSDGALPFDTHGYEAGLAAVAHLYNTSAAEHDGVNQAIYNQKDRDPDVYRVGVLDIERSQEPDIKPEPWQTDTSVGDWFYNVRDVYKTPSHVIEILVDIVAKNGNLLLDIPQRPDGTIDDECRFLLTELSTWMAVCGEGIFGTRPFTTSGEGPSAVHISGFVEDAVDWTSDDYRFTTKDDTIYAFQMRWPEDHRAIIRSLDRSDRVTGVRLLGYGDVPFGQVDGILIAQLPEEQPVSSPLCLAITVAG